VIQIYRDTKTSPNPSKGGELDTNTEKYFLLLWRGIKGEVWEGLETEGFHVEFIY